MNAWAVDSNYAYGTATPTPQAWLHLGGISTSAPSQGFGISINISATAQTENASYATLQLISECTTKTDQTQSKTVLYGTSGADNVLASLDGLIKGPTSINSSSFTISDGDSPAFPLLQTPTPDKVTVSDNEVFDYIAMCRSNAQSDPNVANIWVPLPSAVNWSWSGMAQRNVSNDTMTWEAVGIPATAAAKANVITSEPSWTSVFPYYGTIDNETVTKCQILP